MGAWSVDVLGGDTPLDILGEIEEILGESNDDGGLYPLRLTEEDRARLVPKLESVHHIDAMTRLLSYPDAEDQAVAYTVMGALYLTTGAAWPNAIRDRCVDAAEELARDAAKHGWSDPMERRTYMTNLARQFREHTKGRITDIGHVGLFERLAEHLSAGNTGLINNKA